MAAFNGHQFTVDWDSTALTGVMSTTVNIQENLVDITSNDDNGDTTYLPVAGTRAITVSVEGVTKDEVLIAAIKSQTAAVGAQINIPSDLTTPGNIAGNYLIQSVELKGEHDGYYGFTAELVSTGAQTYTASV